MLAKGELTVFGLICTLCYKLNIIRIQWNSANYQVFQVNSAWCKRVNVISRLYSIAYISFAVVRLYPAYIGFGIKYPIYYPLFHACHIILHLFTVMFDTVIAAYLQEIIELFNQLVHVNKLLGQQVYGEAFKKRGQIREIILKVLVGGTGFGATSFYAAYLIIPQNLNYFYSAVPSKWQSPYTQAFFLTFETIFVSKVVLLHLFNTVLNFLFICSTQYWLRRICIEWPRSFDPLLHSRMGAVYLKISVLGRLWDTACAPALIPWTKSITYCLTVLAWYAAIKFYGEFPWLVYGCMPLFGIVFLFEILIASILMSKVYDYSFALMKNSARVELSSQAGDGAWKKKMLSLRPLRCNMGQFYFMQKSTPLTVLSLVVDQIISLLLAT